MKNFFRKVAFGIGPDEKIPSDPLIWATSQISDKVPGYSYKGKIYSEKELRKHYGKFVYQDRKVLRKKFKKDKKGYKTAKNKVRHETGQKFWRNLEIAIRHKEATKGNSPVLAKLWYFWGNHFTISEKDFLANYSTGAYQRESIRANMNQTFEKLAYDATVAWAMILHLDNSVNVGPKSEDAKAEWRRSNSEPNEHNLDINFFKSSEIPWGANPNKDTLLYYLFRYLEVENKFDRAGSKGSENPYKFNIELRDDKISKYIKKHMQKTALLSYLLYEDNKITIDEISPKNRLGILYNNNTQFTSASAGKSIVSYVTGHAICKGYINGVDHRLNDWPLLENTLFYDQKLINLLNMAAGHQKYADFDLKTNKYHKNANSNTVEFHLKKGVFKNSKKSKSKYQYTNFLSNLLINYVWFKSEGKFQDLLDEIFVDKAKIKNDAWFLKMNDRTIKMNNRNNTILKEYEVKDEDGPLRYSFRASRYDYLRIAKAMLDDWQNDTCVGKYLKKIHELRIPMNNKWKNDKDSSLNPKSYAGKFYTNYTGMKKRNVMGMNGFGGQHIMIDFDLGRIVVINSMHTDYNWKKIAHSVIKKGK